LLTNDFSSSLVNRNQCIAIRDTWAKGHIRLASAYIALGGHSNDACNALQRAVSLDPSNPTARQMLLKELRRDHSQSVPTAPPEEQDESRTRQQNTARASDVDDRMSISDRIQFYWMQTITWYHAQPDDVQTLLKVIAGIVILYVMFGGRFGLEAFGSRPRGYYGRGNAYDRYGTASNIPYGDVRGQPRGYGGNSRVNVPNVPNGNDNMGARQQEQHQYHEPMQGATTQGAAKNIREPPLDPDPSANAHRRTTYDDDFGYQPPRQRSTSFQFPNLMDGSFPSMICMLGIAYICHRNGINPFQVFMMINMMGAGRQRGMGYGGMGYGGMGGMGMAGMGYGMARNAGMFGGGRPRPGYY
jgi:hypothetical protein